MTDQSTGFDSHTDQRSKSREALKPIAAGFVVVVVVLVAVLFFINRDSDETTTPAEDTADAVLGMQWSGKQADVWGNMVYFPKDTKGQPLTERVRDYTGDTVAAASGTPSKTVFQTTDFSGGVPVPFSTQDGPTGFDGTVPIGYSQSAAGAALAAAAYATQVSPVRTTYEEFIAKGTYQPTSAQLAKARERVADEADSRAPGPHGEIAGWHFPMYSIEVFDGDYARVVLYASLSDGNAAWPIELRWDNNTWKFSATGEVQEPAEIPQGVISWARS